MENVINVFTLKRIHLISSHLITTHTTYIIMPIAISPWMPQQRTMPGMKVNIASTQQDILSLLKEWKRVRESNVSVSSNIINTTLPLPVI